MCKNSRLKSTINDCEKLIAHISFFLERHCPNDEIVQYLNWSKRWLRYYLDYLYFCEENGINPDDD